MVTVEETLGPRERTEAASERLDQWRTHLLQLASGSIPTISESSFLGTEMKAASVVATMAELEAVLRELLVSVGEQVNASNVPLDQLRPSIRALAAHSTFQSLLDLRDAEKVWARRANLTTLDRSSEYARLPSRTLKSPQPPLDGRTIQPRHLALVQTVLGIRGMTVSARASTALIKLTRVRNDVAHANMPIDQVFDGAGREAVDLANYLLEIRLLINQIGDAWMNYLQVEGYRTSELQAHVRPSNHAHMAFEQPEEEP